MSTTARPEHVIHIHGVVVIEWLHPRDVRTGLQLVARYGQRGRLPFLYAPCKNASDVHAILERVRASTTPDDVPVVHFEAHGYGGVFGAPAGIAGPDGQGGEALVPWEALIPALRAINVASAFNLMVVGAACHGDALIWRFIESLPEDASRPVLPYPFMAALGPETEIDELLLLRVFETFYDGLLRGQRIDRSVDDANRLLDAPLRLDWLSVYNVANTIMDEPSRVPSEVMQRLLARLLGHEIDVTARQRFPLVRITQGTSED